MQNVPYTRTEHHGVTIKPRTLFVELDVTKTVKSTLKKFNLTSAAAEMSEFLCGKKIAGSKHLGRQQQGVFPRSLSRKPDMKLVRL